MGISKLLKKMISAYRKHEQKKWMDKNTHNSTALGKRTQFSDNIIVGNGTYGVIDVLNDKPELKLNIGNYVSIASEVVFILGCDHNVHRASTYPFKQMCGLVDSDYREAVSKGDITIDDDVWIGYRSIILSGVHVGQGAVIAAGAVVNKDVEPYSIVGGVPAKKVRDRFDKSVIEYLLTLDYSSLTQEMIVNHVKEMYTELDGLSLNEVISLYDWFPKKMITMEAYSNE